MADQEPCIEEAASLDGVPDQAAALFGGDAYASRSWYRGVTQAAVPPGARACFQVALQDGSVVAILPMWRMADGSYASMTTPYTALWSPLLRPSSIETGFDMARVGRALGRRWSRGALTRLDALDPRAPWVVPLLRGLRGAGLVPLRFDHFGNWFVGTDGLGWDAYLARLPGELRATIRRRTRALMEDGGAFQLVDGPAGLDEAVAAYTRMHAASWKGPEPHPDFVATLAREAAADGSLRLGVLSHRGTPVAAQLWLVSGGWAGVQKLAHDEAHRRLAPGTVLTGLIVRHLLEVEHVAELDWGRGDDPYKKAWTGCRRQRGGILLASPMRVAGLGAIAKHSTSFLKKRSKRLLSMLSRTQ